MESDQVKIELGQVNFCLNTLKGSIPSNTFTDFNKTLIDKTTGLYITDPVSKPFDLSALSHIHEIIYRSLTNVSAEERPAHCYWLATLFHSHFSRYDLFREGFSCREAWAHLLRMRYHSMIEVQSLKRDAPEGFTRGERIELLRAFRDWKDFCVNDRHHFLFREQRELGSPEQEVREIIYGKGDRAKHPGKFFVKHPIKLLLAQPILFSLNDEEGQRQLDFLIADWFLRDRYDWFGAFGLMWHRAGKIKWLVISILVLVALFFMWTAQAGVLYKMPALLGFIHAALFLLLVSGIARRTVVDLLLPRLWAAIVVGYLPLFLTSELWKMAYKNWWGATWWGIAALNLVAFCLAFMYLRWAEVGKRLARTPNLGRRIPVIRAAWLTFMGLIISVVSGLVILNFAGLPMAQVAFDEAPHGYAGLGGEVHTRVLFLFAPFALLVGVILQIFWEEKPITQGA